MQPDYRTSVDIMVKSLEDFPWDSKLAYAEFLAQTYYYIRHSTRLLAASAARFSQEDQAMHKRFMKHSDEENSHELLAVRDLQKLGYKMADFRELPQTRSFYEVQYCKIEHCDPAALLGYILALEVTATSLAPIQKKLSGLYGKECVKLIQVHSDEDPDHVEKALQSISALGEQRVNDIEINIEQSAILYAAMIEAVKAKALMMTKPQKKAA
jgi:thiaminase